MRPHCYARLKWHMPIISMAPPACHPLICLCWRLQEKKRKPKEQEEAKPVKKSKSGVPAPAAAPAQAPISAPAPAPTPVIKPNVPAPAKKDGAPKKKLPPIAAAASAGYRSWNATHREEKEEEEGQGSQEACCVRGPFLCKLDAHFARLLDLLRWPPRRRWGTIKDF